MLIALIILFVILIVLLPFVLFWLLASDLYPDMDEELLCEMYKRTSAQDVDRIIFNPGQL